MGKTYIAVLGRVDENTTEEVVIKEIAVNAKDCFEAHKVALYKCDLVAGETVFTIKEAASKIIKFDHKKGFTN